MFCVVKFIDENEIECVPQSWLRDRGSRRYCLWPPYQGRGIYAAIRTSQTPEDDWDAIEVVLLKRNIGKTLAMAFIQKTNFYIRWSRFF